MAGTFTTIVVLLVVVSSSVGCECRRIASTVFLVAVLIVVPAVSVPPVVSISSIRRSIVIAIVSVGVHVVALVVIVFASLFPVIVIVRICPAIIWEGPPGCVYLDLFSESLARLQA